MNSFLNILQTVLPVILALLIGMLCRKTGLISREGINTLKSVVVNITLPAVLLSAFATTPYSLQTVVIPVILFLICLAAWALGVLAKRIFHMSSYFVPFLTTGFEAGMLGYALFQMLYGAERTSEFAILDLGQVLFVFTVFKILLNRSNPETAGSSGKSLFKEMILSPIIIAIASGVLIGASGLYQVMESVGISRVFDACTDFVAAPTGMIILLTIGYDLVFSDIPWKSTGKVVLLRLVIMAMMCGAFLGILKLLWPDLNLTSAALVLFLLPPPFVLPVFADDANQRTYVSSVLSIYTLISIAGFAVLAVISGL